jgi:transmembrane sensor
MSSKQRKEYLLNRYISNQCTREEFNELLKQVNASTDFDDFDGAMQKHWLAAGTERISHMPDWNSMRNNIYAKFWGLKKTRQHLKYAAVIAMIISATTFLIHHNNSIDSQSIKYATQYSAPAKTKVVTLADGTRITLNSNSTLRYPETLDRKTREVYLTGEAYFDVVHNESKPFVIHSGNLKTIVLGTSFIVSAYSQTQPMNVTVLTGKVSVKDEHTNSLAVLTRGQWATAKPGEKTFLLGKLSNPEDAIAWIDNKLIFEDMDLQDVALKLSNKYNVKILINDNKLAHEHITGIFQSQNLDEILTALAQLTHSKYTKQQHIYTLQYSKPNHYKLKPNAY